MNINERTRLLPNDPQIGNNQQGMLQMIYNLPDRIEYCYTSSKNKITKFCTSCLYIVGTATAISTIAFAILNQNIPPHLLGIGGAFVGSVMCCGAICRWNQMTEEQINDLEAQRQALAHLEGEVNDVTDQSRDQLDKLAEINHTNDRITSYSEQTAMKIQTLGKGLAAKNNEREAYLKYEQERASSSAGPN